LSSLILFLEQHKVNTRITILRDMLAQVRI